MHVSKTLLANIRSKDQVAPYGGDEFVVALPDTDLEQAITVAVRIVQTSNDNPLVVIGVSPDSGTIDERPRSSYGWYVRNCLPHGIIKLSGHDRPYVRSRLSVQG